MSVFIKKNYSRNLYTLLNLSIATYAKIAYTYPKYMHIYT